MTTKHKIKVISKQADNPTVTWANHFTVEAEMGGADPAHTAAEAHISLYPDAQDGVETFSEGHMLPKIDAHYSVTLKDDYLEVVEA